MVARLIQDLGLRPAQIKALDKRARHQGQTSAQYVRWLIEQDLLRDKSFDEILGPIRADFRKSHISEDELDRIVDRARGNRRRKRRVARR